MTDYTLFKQPTKKKVKKKKTLNEITKDCEKAHKIPKKIKQSDIFKLNKK